MAKVDVLISGAGPVGLTMANELTRYGISVRIVDKSAERTDKSKALVLWSRTLELFDHAGYVDEFLAAGMQAHGAQMSNGKDVIARISLDDIESVYPYALMIPQSDTERVLEEQLAKRGVKVERTVGLESFTDQGNQVQAVLRKASGESETLTADWLVGCDGAHSAVRHGLGFTFDGTTRPSATPIVPIRPCRRSRPSSPCAARKASSSRTPTGSLRSASTSARSRNTAAAAPSWPAT